MALKKFQVANILKKCTIIQGCNRCNHGNFLGEAKPIGGLNLPPLVEIGLIVNIHVHWLLYLKIWGRHCLASLAIDYAPDIFSIDSYLLHCIPI